MNVCARARYQRNNINIRRHWAALDTASDGILRLSSQISESAKFVVATLTASEAGDFVADGIPKVGTSDKRHDSTSPDGGTRLFTGLWPRHKCTVEIFLERSIAVSQLTSRYLHMLLSQLLKFPGKGM